MKRLKSNERPLFAPVTAVHLTKKDKANKRQNRKLEMRKELQNELVRKKYEDF